jgi:cytochrome c
MINDIVTPVTGPYLGVAGLILAAVLTSVCSPASAAETDREARGRALVTMYCTDCHATENEGESPFPSAPRFRDLHLRYDVELLSEALVEGIVTAHPEMPQFEFDPDQAQDIILYLKSLEPKSSGDVGPKAWAPADEKPTKDQ